uniref:Bm9839 n=1 Tax=Brugia malayi TaxID=6279 RepID=A0A0J9YAB3_BRUMA|nr:Bm9839 [Brugia malayi]
MTFAVKTKRVEHDEWAPIRFLRKRHNLNDRAGNLILLENLILPGIMASMEDIKIVFEYLKREPEMYRILQRFVSETLQFERSLIEGMMEAGRRLEELVGQNAHEVMEENPVPQEPEFDEEEAERTPLPESSEEAENWPCEAEWTPLPYDEEEEENEPEAPVAPMEASGIVEPVESVRELVLRTRTIRIPVLATQEEMAAAVPEEFHPADLGDLPEQLRMELQVPQAEPYTVTQEEGNKIGFCARCGHNLLLPPGYTAAQRTAAVELHALDWCPRACAAVIGERQIVFAASITEISMNSRELVLSSILDSVNKILLTLGMVSSISRAKKLSVSLYCISVPSYKFYQF